MHLIILNIGYLELYMVSYIDLTLIPDYYLVRPVRVANFVGQIAAVTSWEARSDRLAAAHKAADMCCDRALAEVKGLPAINVVSLYALFNIIS